MIVELPVIDAPFQRFKTVLNSKDVALTLRWNTWLQRWALDVEIDDELRVAGLRVVPDIDLLKGYGLDVGTLAVVDWAEKGGFPGRSELPSGEFRILVRN